MPTLQFNLKSYLDIMIGIRLRLFRNLRGLSELSLIIVAFKLCDLVKKRKRKNQKEVKSF